MSAQDHQGQVHPENLPGAEWMFKLHGEIWGPVPASEVYEHMLTGEVDESTLVSREEGFWIPLQQFSEWVPLIHQAKAHLRAMRARAEAREALRRRRMRTFINFGIISAFLVLIGFVLTYMVVVRSPWKNEQIIKRWTSRHVPLLMAVGIGTVKNSSSTDMDAKLGKISIDEILVEDAPDLVAISPNKRNHKKRVRKNKNKTGTKSASKTALKADSTQQIANIGTLSRQEIIRKVYAKRNMNKLKACLFKEISRNSDLPGRVVINFSIRNDGHVHNVRMDDIRLENGPLHQCFQRKLAKISFPPYQGQVQNVTVPFDWKR